MNPNTPGGDPSYPGNPNNPPSYPQQPRTYPEQPPTYPQQPPSYPQQPPVYNQGQQPYPQQPVYPQQQPPKKSNKSWIIGCSSAAGVVIVLCSLMSFALFRVVFDPIRVAFDPIHREVDARATLQNLCLDMQRQNYVPVYNSLSIAAKGRIGTVDQFMNRVDVLDRSDGAVTSCIIDADSLRPAAAHSDGKHMDIGIWVSRGNSTSNHPNRDDTPVTITLIYENNAWKVDDATPTLILF